MEEVRKKVDNFKNHILKEIKNAESNIRDLENKIEYYYEAIRMLDEIMSIGEEIENSEEKDDR